ncbi:MAG: DnaA regulatory inactivator Hda [Alphaproteobacteria bacterium]|nr:MAG: DnaA regulatory inactivator Hda [Alphaproteobacteria bacterium]
MEQLVFELAPPEPPRLSNFLPGRNRELIAALTRFVEGVASDTGLFVWGASGAGKTHLLRAAVALAAQRGAEARFYAEPGAFADPAPGSAVLIAIDRIDEADPEAAARIFTLYNALKQCGGRLLAASRVPVAMLALREDLRTRLGWGLVYEAFDLSAEVIDYLLRHGRRDMGSLLAAVAALDRLSLAAKRPITVPLLREWLQATLDWETREKSAPALD